MFALAVANRSKKVDLCVTDHGLARHCHKCIYLKPFVVNAVIKVLNEQISIFRAGKNIYPTNHSEAYKKVPVGMSFVFFRLDIVITLEAGGLDKVRTR